MTARHQDRATQSREQKQKVQLFALAFMLFEVLVGKHRHHGGGGDDQADVEQGVSIHSRSDVTCRGPRKRLPDGDEGRRQTGERQAGRQRGLRLQGDAEHDNDRRSCDQQQRKQGE
jgi:hypothetical protein